MRRELFLERCYEMVKQNPKDTLDVVTDKALGLVWEVNNYGSNPDATKESLTKAVGDMYISLMAINYAFGLDSKEMGKYIYTQLGISDEEYAAAEEMDEVDEGY